MRIIRIAMLCAVVFLLAASPVFAADESNDSLMNLTISIVWEDQDNSFSTRPNEVPLVLTKNGINFQEITLSASDNWTIKIENLPSFSSASTTLDAVSNDAAAKWIIESSSDTGEHWIQYTTDSDWSTSTYSADFLLDSSTENMLQVVNSSETSYLVFYKDENGELLTDQNGTIIQQCSPGETYFSVPSSAYSILVSHLNSDNHFAVQILEPQNQTAVTYSVAPLDPLPCYKPSINNTTVTFTLTSLSASINLKNTDLLSSEDVIETTISSSDGFTDSTILSSSNGWTADITALRTSPLIDFSIDSPANAEKISGAASLKGHSFSILGDSFSEISEKLSEDDPEGYAGDCKWWNQIASSLDMTLLSNQAVGGSGININTSAFDRISLLKKGAQAPDDILILIGINDLINGASTEELSSDYQDMLNKLQTTYPLSNLILFTYPQVYGYFSSAIRECNEVIRQSAAVNGLLVIDLENWSVSEEEIESYLRTDDDLHPNREGQLLMGELAVQELEEVSVSAYSLSTDISDVYSYILTYKEGGYQIELSNNASKPAFHYTIIVIAAIGFVVLFFLTALIILLLKRQKKFL